MFGTRGLLSWNGTEASIMLPHPSMLQALFEPILRPSVSNLEKIPGDIAAADGLRCSFCGKPPAEDSDLIAGPRVFICDECIATCSDMRAERESRGGEHVHAEDEQGRF
jgi:hypothetical protein